MVLKCFRIEPDAERAERPQLLVERQRRLPFPPRDHQITSPHGLAMATYGQNCARRKSSGVLCGVGRRCPGSRSLLTRKPQLLSLYAFQGLVNSPLSVASPLSDFPGSAEEGVSGTDFG